VGRIGDFFRNLFSRSEPLDRVATYIIREHERGRPLVEILDDPFVRNRAKPEDLARLFENPDVIRALGDDAIQSARTRLRSS
jgi:hypothetical protein